MASSIGSRGGRRPGGSPGPAIRPACTSTDKEHNNGSGHGEMVQRRERLRLHRPRRRRRRRVFVHYRPSRPRATARWMRTSAWSSTSPRAKRATSGKRARSDPTAATSTTPSGLLPSWWASLTFRTGDCPSRPQPTPGPQWACCARLQGRTDGTFRMETLLVTGERVTSAEIWSTFSRTATGCGARPDARSRSGGRVG